MSLLCPKDLLTFKTQSQPWKTLVMMKTGHLRMIRQQMLQPKVNQVYTVRGDISISFTVSCNLVSNPMISDVDITEVLGLIDDLSSHCIIEKSAPQ